jgi:antitoxin component YwqK of YwqJK toxin-antitoxin module
MKDFILIALTLFALGCNGTSDKKNEIVIDASRQVRSIVLQKNDSLAVRINIDSLLNLRSIVEVNKGVIEGEALVFYSNGKLEKKIHSEDGIREGHTQYFFESGALKSELFYCNGKPNFYAGEYWDGHYSRIKYSIQFGENGKINKIKSFDSLGVLLRDSVPPANAEYPEEQ